MSVNNYSHAKAIGSAVRAELARNGKSIASLSPLLGIGRTAVYSRTRGEQPFDYVELQLIADYLQVPVINIIRSAELNEVAA